VLGVPAVTGGGSVIAMIVPVVEGGRFRLRHGGPVVAVACVVVLVLTHLTVPPAVLRVLGSVSIAIT
jgi:small neutral amino acid transporter SnatA (MarC family)